MKVIKLTVYIKDFEDYGSEEYKYLIEEHRHLPAKVFIDEEADIGEWHDDHELNFSNASKEKYNKYFKPLKGELI